MIRGPGKTEERDSHSRLEGGRFNKPGNLQGLSWMMPRWVGLYTHLLESSSSYRGINYWVQSHVPSRWSQNTLLSEGRVLGTHPLWEEWAEHTFQTRGRGWGRFHLPRSSSRGNIVLITSSKHKLLQTASKSQWPVKIFYLTAKSKEDWGRRHL